jgi:hypothetical protein
VTAAHRWLTDPARFAVGLLRERRDRLPEIRVRGGRGNGVVYYLAPDFDEPSGGVHAMYRHVDALNAAGIDAAILHTRRRFRCTWFEHETVVTDTSTTSPGPCDVLVVPEIYAGLLPSLPPGVRHVVFNQGPHLTFRRDASKVARHYRHSQSLIGVLTVSEHSERLLRFAFPGLHVRRVHLGLDSGLFPAPEEPAGRVITYMPRRRQDDPGLVLELLRQRGSLDGWDVHPIQGTSYAETADAMRGSSIFLHFTYQEGFGLPAAEAMACGNLVIGFDGFGGREFFRPEFSRRVPTGDVLAFAATVEDVLAEERSRPGTCRALGLGASAYVRSTYTMERERGEVVRFFTEALVCSESPTRRSRPRESVPGAPVLGSSRGGAP